MLEQKPSSNLTLHWAFVGVFFSLIIAYQVVCHLAGAEIQINIAEEQRIVIRSILYAVAIILFPLSNLLRHILLRLNQTMPGSRSAQSRYLITTFITLAMIETVGVLGLIMFILGDDYNTLYIFSTLAALGLFLHRPKAEDYLQIIHALEVQE